MLKIVLALMDKQYDELIEQMPEFLLQLNILRFTVISKSNFVAH